MEEYEEQVAALKKAYAEVILNTAKESAARILASESNTRRFQHKLTSVKDEALHTLLRVKSIMNAKINEVEAVCMGQKKRILELENQLNESGYTIRCLKAELKRVTEEMEMVKSSPSELLGSDAHEKSDPKNLQPRLSQESSPESNCCSNPGMAPFTMRNKEPELYRNGCTQRIRALEQNSMTGKLHQGQMDRQFPKANSVVCKDENVQNPFLGDSYLNCNAVDHTNELKVVATEIDSGKNDQIANSPSIFSSQKSSRLPHFISPCSNKGVANHELSKIMVEFDECSQKDLRALSSSVEKCGLLRFHASPGQLLLKDELSNTNIKSCTTYSCMESINKMNGHPGSPTRSGMNICQNRTEISDGPKCKIDFKSDVALQSSEQQDGRTCQINKVMNRTSGERVLKYTFQRKRKRGSSTNTNENILPGKKNTVKRKTCDTNSLLEPKKPSLNTESSRDSRRIAQVARQLISLSEKRW